MNPMRLGEHTIEEHRTVRVSRRVSAPPERVFDAWLDPEKVRSWMVAPDAGEIVSVALDSKVSGSFSFVVRREGMTIAHNGEYLQLDRPRHLSFTWKMPRVSLETGVVTVDLVPLGEETEIALRHEGVFPEYEARTEQGWRSILESIATIVANPDEPIRAPEESRGDLR